VLLVCGEIFGGQDGGAGGESVAKGVLGGSMFAASGAGSGGVAGVGTFDVGAGGGGVAGCGLVECGCLVECGLIQGGAKDGNGGGWVHGVLCSLAIQIARARRGWRPVAGEVVGGRGEGDPRRW